MTLINVECMAPLSAIHVNMLEISASSAAARIASKMPNLFFLENNVGKASRGGWRTEQDNSCNFRTSTVMAQLNSYNWDYIDL